MSTEPRLTPRRLKVFMCHASEDKEPVRKLSTDLRDAGFDPWLDDEKLMPGEDWQQSIDKALRDAGAVIVCLSKRSVLKEGYVQKEIDRAIDLAKEKMPGSPFIIPVKLDDADIPPHLVRWHWAEMSGPDGLPRLLDALKARALELERRGGAAGRQSEPPFDDDPTDPAARLTTIAVMGTKGGVGKGVFVSFAAQLVAVSGSHVAVIDLDLAASGTTLSAEADYGHTKPVSVLTAFDHVARKATNISPYAPGASEELWNITPSFLNTFRGGRIWLLPAREPSNPGQSFDVVANVLPPEQREEKLAAVVQEQIDRISKRHPEVRVILIDCGAERNPIYGAAFSRADRGYILFGTDPEYFGEVRAVRDELLRMFRGINPARIHAVANNVMSTADEQRCRAGISPIPLLAAIPSDPVLRRARAENHATHLDLGHEAVSEAVRDAIALAIEDNGAPLIDAEQLGCVSIVTLLINGGGLDELSQFLKNRFRIAVGASIVAAAASVALGAAWALTDIDAELARRVWLIVGLIAASAVLIAAIWFGRAVRSRLATLAELTHVRSSTPRGLLATVDRMIRDLRKNDSRLARDIQRWIHRRQSHERQAR